MRNDPLIEATNRLRAEMTEVRDENAELKSRLAQAAVATQDAEEMRRRYEIADGAGRAVADALELATSELTTLQPLPALLGEAIALLMDPRAGDICLRPSDPQCARAWDKPCWRHRRAEYVDRAAALAKPKESNT